MGFYFRKSKKIGPIRINFSNNGIGLSAGIKGARISTNSKGTYINVGSNGLYYREKIGRGISQLNFSNWFGKNNHMNPNTDLLVNNIINTNQFIISSNEQNLTEINNKINSTGITLKIIILTIFLCFILTLVWVDLFCIWLILGLVLVFIFNVYDNSRKITKLFYELNSNIQNKINEIDFNFINLIKSKKIWFVNVEQSQKVTPQNKYGLELLGRKSVLITKNMPPFIETNLEIWSINIDNLSLYFFPERILIFNNKIYSSVQYNELKMKYTEIIYLEDDILHNDVQIIGKSYKYSNINGDPDNRYINNPELPLISYGLIKFYSSNGLNINFMISNKMIAQEFFNSFKKIS